MFFEGCDIGYKTVLHVEIYFNPFQMLLRYVTFIACEVDHYQISEKQLQSRLTLMPYREKSPQYTEMLSKLQDWKRQFVISRYHVS